MKTPQLSVQITHSKPPRIGGLWVILLFFISAAKILAAEPADNLAAKTFTLEMAQHLLGGPTEPAKRNSQADIRNGSTVVSQCSYSVKGDDITPRTISLLLRRAGDAAEAKNIFLSSKRTYNGQDITDLGDGAYRTAAPAQLNVLKSSNWLIISAGAFPKADTALQEKAAREILKNIRD
ncbi:MAG: hypothetical protein M3Z64_09315 [Verrucomicrobiota bacterium]|nr:hypothetical protein [Verrucomicrobiota bacterium]